VADGTIPAAVKRLLLVLLLSAACAGRRHMAKRSPVGERDLVTAAREIRGVLEVAFGTGRVEPVLRLIDPRVVIPRGWCQGVIPRAAEPIEVAVAPIA
jgi:hypothetical protein